MVKIIRPLMPQHLLDYMERRMKWLAHGDHTVTLCDDEVPYEQAVIDFYGLEVLSRDVGHSHVQLYVRGLNYRGQATE